MTGRRLAAALLAAAGFAPAALVGALALHVALEHHAVPVHEPAVGDAGHRASGVPAEHEHEIGARDDVAARSTPAPTASLAPTGAATAAGPSPLRAPVALAAPPGAPPPRATGPLLLALLSVLRV